MATEAQVAANRVNGLKGGVKTEAGKAVSRLNARKHGIFASALTECASDGFFAALLGELIAEIKPVGIVEQLLVDKLAVTYLRMRRCAEAETLHFRSHWKFNPANFGKFPHNETVVTLGLYDARLTKQFLRLLHEIEWRRTARSKQGVGREEAQETQEMKNEPNPAAEAPVTNLANGSACAPLSVRTNLRKVRTILQPGFRHAAPRTISFHSPLPIPDSAPRRAPRSS